MSGVNYTGCDFLANGLCLNIYNLCLNPGYYLMPWSAADLHFVSLIGRVIREYKHLGCVF